METIQTTRQPTEAAQAAKAIRGELKAAFPGIKFSVTSSNFSMGNSVNISWTDGPGTESVEAITNKYQYGHFNGMEDIYEYSNSRDDMPQAKYVSTSRTISDEQVRAYSEQLAEDFGIEPPGEDLGSSFEFNNEYTNWHQLAWRELRNKELN